MNTATPDATLLVPANDTANPKLSIVIPAMNEQLTILEFVQWCHQGIAETGIEAEILIVDSSSDETPQIAIANGARVLKVPKRGLGRAYIDSIPYIRGQYVLMGDADCTYDFRQISQFLERFLAGDEYVMGSRYKGYIQPEAMPKLHQYFGTPVTTWILNLLYSTKFTDIHCGMRGITLEALKKIDLESQSWEYASEMVLKSVCLRLRTSEVPVRFLKDKEGRLSHMKRNGWLEPWRAGWKNLRAMFLYGADFFLLKPGLIALFVGLILMLPTIAGPVSIGPITLSLYWSLLGLTLSVVGISSALLGAVVQVLYGYVKETSDRWLAFFEYDRMMFASGVSFIAGFSFCVPLILKYFKSGFSLPNQANWMEHCAVFGLFFVASAFLLFNNTLVVHAVSMRIKKRMYQA